MRASRMAVAVGFVAVFGTAAPSAAGPKSTLFDLDKDLMAFFQLQAKIMATNPGRDDTPAELAEKRGTRAALFKQHGIRDDKHWENESHAGMGYSFTKRAEKIYGGGERILDMRRAAGDGKTLQQYLSDRVTAQERSQQDLEQLKNLHNPALLDPALLEPIEGVTLEQYVAAANAATFHGDDFAAVTKETGISQAKYERLTEKWTERMRADVTRLVMSKYGAYFMAAARGRFASAARDLSQALLNDRPLQGPEPLPFERWVEITQYYDSRAGEIKGPADVTRVLEPYGLSFYEWNIASNWWGRKRAEAMKRDDRQFLGTWLALMEKYRKQFAANAK